MDQESDEASERSKSESFNEVIRKLRIQHPPKASPLTSEVERENSRSLRENKFFETILDAWVKQAEDDRSVRKRYAYWLFMFLLVQAISMNVAFFLIGTKHLDVEEWTARIFIVGVFTELAAMVFWIVKYLFASKEDAMLQAIQGFIQDGASSKKDHLDSK